MNRWRIAVFAVAMLCAGAFAGEQGHSEALLDRLAGNWVLSGKLAGGETTHDISADWALNRGYLRLHEISREKAPSGAAAYEAIVFISYNAKTDDYTCLWFGSVVSLLAIAIASDVSTTGKGALVVAGLVLGWFEWWAWRKPDKRVL